MIITHYTDPYECWQHLKGQYEVNTRIFFISWKEEMMTMENYLKEIKGIIDQLTIISVTIPEDLLSLLLVHFLPKEKY
jgi:hypothetical protein